MTILQILAQSADGSEISVNHYLDIIAVIAAIVAIVYAGRESRRNNRVMLKFRKCSASSCHSVTENNGESFAEFKLIVQNCGIALHQIEASVSFTPLASFGSFSFPINKSNRSSGIDEFAKGMIVEFGLKSYQFDDGTLAHMSHLQNPTIQNAVLCFYSQGYLAASFRIGGYADRIKSKWNGLAYRFNDLFTRSIGTNSEGQNVIRQYQILPLFTVLSFHITNFIQWSNRDEAMDLDTNSSASVQETAGD